MGTKLTFTIPSDVYAAVVIFPTVLSAQQWYATRADRSYSILSNSMWQYAIAGTYQYTVQLEYSSSFMAYFRYYDTPQTHPKIPFPYEAWAVILHK